MFMEQKDKNVWKQVSLRKSIAQKEAGERGQRQMV